jgi:hypothetical protein
MIQALHGRSPDRRVAALCRADHRKERRLMAIATSCGDAKLGEAAGPGRR